MFPSLSWMQFSVKYELCHPLCKWLCLDDLLLDRVKTARGFQALANKGWRISNHPTTPFKNYCQRQIWAKSLGFILYQSMECSKHQTNGAARWFRKKWTDKTWNFHKIYVLKNKWTLVTLVLKRWSPFCVKRSETNVKWTCHMFLSFSTTHVPSTVIAPLATLLWRIEPGFGLTSIHWFQRQKLRICRSWCIFFTKSFQQLEVLKPSMWLWWTILNPKGEHTKQVLIFWMKPSLWGFRTIPGYQSHYRSEIRIKTSIGDIAMRYTNIIIHQCLWIE